MTRKGDTVMIPVLAIEFREGGNTLWIHGPRGRNGPSSQDAERRDHVEALPDQPDRAR